MLVFRSDSLKWSADFKDRPGRELTAECQALLEVRIDPLQNEWSAAKGDIAYNTSCKNTSRSHVFDEWY